MKKYFILFLFLPFIAFGQYSKGQDTLRDCKYSDIYCLIDDNAYPTHIKRGNIEGHSYHAKFVYFIGNSFTDDLINLLIKRISCKFGRPIHKSNFADFKKVNKAY